MFLVFDTETSGLPVKGLPKGDPAQPRIVQLGAILYGADGEEIGTYRTLIEPEGWGITDQAFQVHGITIQDCQKYGIPIKVALLQFVSFIQKSKHVIAHHYNMDAAMIDREMSLANASDQGLKRSRLRQHDTMKTGTALMDDGLYPSLASLHELLTGEPVTEDHDALADCRSTWRCFRELVKLKLIEL